MPQPAVSVIVPNYNHAPFLRRRLDSIFNQTYQDFEVIILDDCSSDNSKEIIEQYRNRPQISHIVYNEVNSGSPFKQWAKGFDLAKGEYIWIAESDDWAELNFLEETVQRIETNNVNLVFANSYIVTPFEKKIDVKIERDVLFDGKSFLRRKMIFQNFILNASAVLFKRKTLAEIPKTYQNFKSSGDWLFWIEFCLVGNVYFCSKILNYNNRHGGNTTTQWGKRMSSGQSAVEDCMIFHYLKMNGCIPSYHCHSIVAGRLKWADANVSKFDSIACYEAARKCWKGEIRSEWFSTIIFHIVNLLYVILKTARIKS